MSRKKCAPGFLLVAIAASCGVMAADHASMRPSLVALQVENLDASVRWYTNYLHYELKVRREPPGHQLKLAILSLGDFDLELVENSKTLKKAELLSGGATDITGFAKVTFTIENVAALYRRLNDQGAAFAITLRDSNTKPDEQFFVVLDNENNWLQFVGKK
jgi:hypothetical protein